MVFLSNKKQRFISIFYTNYQNCSEKGVECRLLECKVKQPLNIEELDSVNIELNISSNVVGILEVIVRDSFYRRFLAHLG